MLRIVTPVYNSEDFIGKCINSTKLQSFKNFTHYIIDDCSTDNTYNILKDLVGDDSRYKISQNEVKGSTLATHIKLMENFEYDPDDIIIHLDGDDWLYDEHVLNTIKDTYNSKGCWATYGDYVATDGSPSICRETNDNSFRQTTHWKWSHLRTFKKFIWDHINHDDFLDNNGQLYTSAPDLAILLPILEMVGYERLEYIKKPLLVYNRNNILNEDKSDLGDQIRCALEIKRKKTYTQL